MTSPTERFTRSEGILRFRRRRLQRVARAIAHAGALPSVAMLGYRLSRARVSERATAMAIRIVTGGIAQETNTFQWEPTTYEDFQKGSSFIDRGEEILALEGTGLIYGGIIAEAKSQGVELIPTTYGRAVPGGRVTRHAFETLRDEILDSRRHSRGVARRWRDARDPWRDGARTSGRWRGTADHGHTRTCRPGCTDRCSAGSAHEPFRRNDGRSHRICGLQRVPPH
ncbi:MAG: hypothetical protein DCC58_01220 [Chloroflexi bacterium]|nr:MAG: hypothetical protein DCC58_01220 [Chloroflexota bacterium]